MRHRYAAAVLEPPPSPPRTDLLLADRTLAVRHLPGRSPNLPRAVYLHGLGGSALNWTDLMARLADAVDGWAIDLPGFGGSPPPRDGDYSLTGHARAAIDVIDHLGGRPVHLFGNSLGGAVAVAVAAKRPDLVRTLTLVSPALPTLIATRSNMHLPVIAVPGVGERLVSRYLRADAAGRVGGTISVTFADPSRVPRIRFEETTAEVREHDRMPYATDAFLRSLRGLLRSFADRGPDRPWRLAERVRCPTMVIYGRTDPLIDARSAYRATRRFRHAHVIVLPDCGHVAQMEHPEFVAAVWRQYLLSGP